MKKILDKINRKNIYMGYILIAIAINGFFGIFRASDNPGTPRWAWYALAVIGIIIVGLKTLKFPTGDRLKIVLADLIFIAILLFFAMINLPSGINFIIGSVLAVLFLFYIIDARLLSTL